MIVVIGGGIAGISAAARLSALGPVTVLEGESALAFHASGRSAALFIESYGNPVVQALNRASRAPLWTESGGVLSDRGLLLLGRDCEGAAFAADRQDLGMEEIGLDEAVAMVPIVNRATVTRAAYRGDVADLDTDLLVQNFARTARANGTQMRTGVRVDSFAREGTGWRISWPGGDLHADVVVNAAGPWADAIAAMAGAAPVGLRAFRRSMAQLPAPGGHDVSGWPFLDAAGSRWYAKPGSGKLTVSPAEEDPAEPHDAYSDDMVIAEGLARYGEMVNEPVVRVERTWAGLRTFAPDRSLVIGPDPALPGFFWCAGQGGYGFQTSPAAAQLLADLIAGRPPELAPEAVAALSPGRFAR